LEDVETVVVTVGVGMLLRDISGAALGTCNGQNLRNN